MSFDPASLNSEQREAVLHGEGPMMVFAGAGSGKTRVITCRIARLIEAGVAPYRILSVTFTNKAAKEMVGRVEEMVGPRAKDVWMGTFHSVCSRILRRDGQAIGLDPRFVVYDDSDQVSVIKSVLKKIGVDDKTVQPRAVLNEISRAKERLVGPEKYAHEASGFFEKLVAQAYKQYQDELSKANALDFDDIIGKAVRLLEQSEPVRAKFQSQFQHVLVDEYQDVNYAQYMFADIVAGGHGNLVVVGDDDQSIYGWRGADISLMRRFSSDHPSAKLVTLSQNYRSTQRILDAAHQVIRHNRSRADKKLWTDKAGGAPVTVSMAGTEQDEAIQVADSIVRQVRAGNRRYGDCAVLYRMNAQSRVLEEAFLAMRVPHVLVGGQRFYERKEVKDMVAYLRLVLNNSDDASFRRVVNVPARGIGQATLKQLDDWAVRGTRTLWDVAMDTSFQQELNKKALSSLRGFLGVIAAGEDASRNGEVTPILKTLLEKSGYLDALRAERTDEAQSRLENLQEFVNVTTEFDQNPDSGGLASFLESVALISDIDSLTDSGDAVTLMTLHSSKGLEFPVVYMVGLEESVFPHSRALGDDHELEEERRLCYVGMTRAREELHMTHAQRRSLFGQPAFNLRSRFVDDLESYETLFGTARSAPVNREVRQERSGTYSVVEPAAERSRPTWDPPFKVGAKVVHQKFGQGVVVACGPLKNDAEVTVAFPGGVGVKKLVQSLAKLEAVS